MGVVDQVYLGRDGVVRAVEVHTATGKLERPIQHLYPMELSRDRSKPLELNPLAETFQSRRQVQPLQQRTLGQSPCMSKFLVRFLISH